MVNIDTVYQKVLNFASKEQRGYITPQEFNLFANQAQKEIFEQYFYDTNQFARVPGNDTVYADVDDMLEEKMQIFQEQQVWNINSNMQSLNGDVYRVYSLQLGNGGVCEILRTKDYNDAMMGGPLTRPSTTRPIANIRNNRLRVSDGGNTNITNAMVFYFRAPVNPTWDYFVVSGKALYNSNLSVDFELHPAEEVELVYKILKYAGVSMQRDDIMKVGQGLDSQQQQQEKQ